VPWDYNLSSEYLLMLDVAFPDPFAVVTVGGEQTKTTQIFKKTLNPHWNEGFDLWVSLSNIARSLLTIL
jgi:Ca2+-dependent lipid-binding protein